MGTRDWTLPVLCGAVAISAVFVGSRLDRFVYASQAPGSSSSGKSAVERRDWPAYGGTPENMHYSELAQINRTNVKELSAAWSFDTGEAGGLQTSPIIVEGVLYGITPTQKVFALDAASGKLIWKFDSGIKGTQPDRGLAYWSCERDR